MTRLRHRITGAILGAITTWSSTWSSSVLLPAGLMPFVSAPLPRGQLSWGRFWPRGSPRLCDQPCSRAYNADMAWQVVTGFPSFIVDVLETVLVTLVFVVVKPRDSTIRMHMVVLTSLAILLPVAPVFADKGRGSVGRL